MPADIDESNGRMNIAYAGVKPWHGYGQKLTPDAPLEVWSREAGLDFKVVECPAVYTYPGEEGPTETRRKVLVRDDTRAALSMVSKDYKVVQPEEVVEFFRDLTGAGGLQMETAGSLMGGRRIWTMAKAGEGHRVGGSNDEILPYLLLATSFDGTLATTGMLTSVRVVCNNTLNFAILDAESGHKKSHVKIPHMQVFDPTQMKVDLGLAKSSWESFIKEIDAMAEAKLTQKDSLKWLLRVFAGENSLVEDADDKTAEAIKDVYTLYDGAGRGSDLGTSKGTLWGLVNAVTGYVDHRVNARSDETRINHAWFGEGAGLKAKAYSAAIELIS